MGFPRFSRDEDRGKHPDHEKEPERPLPTDEEIASRLRINPGVLITPRVRSEKVSTAPISQPEGPRQPGEGKV